MLNNYKIIINKGKRKKKLFLFLDLKETMLCAFVWIVTYQISTIFTDELYALLTASGLAISIAVLFLEMPGGISVMQILKLAYKYYFKSEKEYYYYKLPKEKKEEVKHVENKEEKRYKATTTKRKKAH